MEEWRPMSEQNPFKDMIEFQNTQWYFIDSDKEQKGPILTRLLLHKACKGDIDGMTLVYNNDLHEWKKISDVPHLRNALSKAIEEEDMAEEVVKKSSSHPGVDVSSNEMIFDVHDNEPTPKQRYLEMLDEEMKRNSEAGLNAGVDSKNKDGIGGVGGKRSFLADDGTKYCWDEEEKDWVEGSSGSEAETEENELPTFSADIGESSHKEGLEEIVREDKSNIEGDGEPSAKRRRTRKKKVKKVSGSWVYISGLPMDCTLDEIQQHFTKVGLVAISPVDQLPKIRLYRDSAGAFKGDCRLCYIAQESADMAIEILDGGFIRPSHKISVSSAVFVPSDGGDGFSGSNRPKASRSQVRVAQAAMRQALAWNEDDDSGVSRSRALRIVVLESMFEPSDCQQQGFLEELQEDVEAECGKCGEVEKITVCSQSVLGVVIVKFKTSFAAQGCVKLMDGRFFAGRRIRCHFWDGQTDYRAQRPAAEEQATAEEEERMDAFGDWLEDAELPPELHLRTE